MAEAIKFYFRANGDVKPSPTPHDTVSVYVFSLSNKICGYNANKCRLIKVRGGFF